MTTEDMLGWVHDVPKGSRQIFEHILKNKPVKNIMELGCYIGNSLIGFLDIFPDAHATGVDLWNNIHDSELVGIDFNVVEKHFNLNVRDYAHRIEKRKGDSKKILRQLLTEGRNFDLIYIDGSHTAFDVYHDAVISWMLLNNRGIMIFDDYCWNKFSSDVLNIPHHAIKHFLTTYKGEYEILHIGYRVFIQKLSTVRPNIDKIVAVPNLGFFSIFSNDKISKVLENGDIWEPWLYKIFSDVVKSGQNTIDVGAYIGTHTVRLAQLCAPGKVHAFEPVYHNKLKTNITLNKLDNVIIHEVGLAEKEKNANATWIWSLDTHNHSGENNYGCTGLDICPMGKPTWLQNLKDPIPVKLMPLDSYNLENIGFIKLDVEGLERDVIRGAIETIKRCRPIITLECWKDHNGNVQDISELDSPLEDLRQLGYDVRHVFYSDFVAYPLESL